MEAAFIITLLSESLYSFMPSTSLCCKSLSSGSTEYMNSVLRSVVPQTLAADVAVLPCSLHALHMRVLVVEGIVVWLVAARDGDSLTEHLK